jgi:hypothetical protein
VSYYESRIKALEARIEEMAQLERMKAVKVEAQLMVSIGELQSENTRLKTEVERLTLIVGADAIDRERGMCCDASAQVERLTKAGDAMIDEWWLQLSCPEWMKKSWMQEQAIVDWNAAKKGGQP